MCMSNTRIEISLALSKPVTVYLIVEDGKVIKQFGSSLDDMALAELEEGHDLYVATYPPGSIVHLASVSMSIDDIGASILTKVN